MKSPLELLQAILSDPTNPDVVNTLVAHDATFVSLSYYDPERLFRTFGEAVFCFCMCFEGSAD